MTVRYAVTFEFDLQAPITHRGTVTATTMPTCFARAAREAVKAHPNLHWTSMVCVLLERLQNARGAQDEELSPDEDADTERGEVSDDL